MENCMYSTPYIIIVILNIRVHQWEAHIAMHILGSQWFVTTKAQV
jgi:hypothetical protein